MRQPVKMPPTHPHMPHFAVHGPTHTDGFEPSSKWVGPLKMLFSWLYYCPCSNECLFHYHLMIMELGPDSKNPFEKEMIMINITLESLFDLSSEN
jgi:hypothetical protein